MTMNISCVSEIKLERRISVILTVGDGRSRGGDERSLGI